MKTEVPIALSVHKLSKRFGDVVANDEVSLQLEYGRIHALLGENGAGKSTLVSMLYGLLRSDGGEVYVDGSPALIHHPGQSLRWGMGLVRQHFSLIYPFTVLDNLILGREPGNMVSIDRDAARREITILMQQYDFDLPLDQTVESLPVGIMQQVEIVRILYSKARILLFDEPTAALVSSEIDRFLEILHTLRVQGMAILLITHRMPEVMRCADEVTVLRHGRVVLQKALGETKEKEIATAIVGETLPEERYPLPKTQQVLFEAEQIYTSIQENNQLRLCDVSFTLHSGEILGIAGVAGNGQEKLIDAILGLLPLQSGRVTFLGHPLEACSPQERREMGIALIPQDRIHEALLLPHSVRENFLINRWAWPAAGKRWLPLNAIDPVVMERIRLYQIAAPDVTTRVEQLSGGHQQRVVIARETLSSPRMIVAHNPTRGLDLRAARFVHETLVKHCEEGGCVLLISSELPELFLLCHRIAVIHRGVLRDIRKTNDWTSSQLGQAMVGGRT